MTELLAKQASLSDIVSTLASGSMALMGGKNALLNTALATGGTAAVITLLARLSKNRARREGEALAGEVGGELNRVTNNYDDLIRKFMILNRQHRDVPNQSEDLTKIEAKTAAEEEELMKTAGINLLTALYALPAGIAAYLIHKQMKQKVMDARVPEEIRQAIIKLENLRATKRTPVVMPPETRSKQEDEELSDEIPGHDLKIACETISTIADIAVQI